MYRDIQDLVLSGVPIRGEAGVGYILPFGFDLPPLMFTEEELEALILGVRVVQGWGDSTLAQAAQQVQAKVEAVLPERLQHLFSTAALFAINFQRLRTTETNDDLAILRQAIRERRKVSFQYTRLDGQLSARTIRPLCLTFFAPSWMLSGWCEKRNDFRNFRTDRIEQIVVTKNYFEEEPGKGLSDFLRLVNSK